MRDTFQCTGTQKNNEDSLTSQDRVIGVTDADNQQTLQFMLVVKTDQKNAAMNEELLKFRSSQLCYFGK